MTKSKSLAGKSRQEVEDTRDGRKRNFQGLACYERAAWQAAGHYGRGGEWDICVLHLSENVTFLLTERQDKVPRKVMRVSRLGYHSRSEIEAEIRWLEHLDQANIVETIGPVLNDQGEHLTQVEVDSHTYLCIVFPYLKGRILDPKRDESAAEDFRQIGRIAALLHRDTMEWRESRSLIRPHWNYENMVGVCGLFGDWRQCRELDSKEVDVMERTCRQIGERLYKYGKSGENYGLIHGDLRAANLLKDGSVIQVIDFDDCGFGWHLYDLAASMSFLEDDCQVGQWIRAWLSGYQTVMPLLEKDLREIPTFLMARRIQLLAWLTSHEDSDPVKSLYPGFAKDTVRLARDYGQYLRGVSVQE